MGDLAQVNVDKVHRVGQGILDLEGVAVAVKVIKFVALLISAVVVVVVGVEVEVEALVLVEQLPKHFVPLVKIIVRAKGELIVELLTQVNLNLFALLQFVYHRARHVL